MKTWKILTVVLFVYTLLAVIGGFCWPYTLETWGGWLDRPVEVSFGAGMLIGIVPLVGQISIPAAVITWIGSFFLG